MVHLQWYGGEGEILSLQSELRRFLTRSGALSSLLIDSAGRLLTMVGSVIPQFDITSFVSLSASDFAANRELARLLGEETFQDLYHQGERHGIYITQIYDGMLLAVLFDRSTTLGLIRHSIRKARPKIQPLLEAALTPPVEEKAGKFGEEELGQISEDVDRMFE